MRRMKKRERRQSDPRDKQGYRGVSHFSFKVFLRTKSIPLVKVLWWNHGVEEASWELQMRDRYPHLFK
jgi:hypothetical protein